MTATQKMIKEKAERLSAVIKAENRKPKSERRSDLDQIQKKNKTLLRWIKEL